jgi:ribosomal protein S2
MKEKTAEELIKDIELILVTMPTLPKSVQDTLTTVGKHLTILAIAEKQCGIEHVATVAEVYKSRYTLEWNNHDLPQGTKLYLHPDFYKSKPPENEDFSHLIPFITDAREGDHVTIKDKEFVFKIRNTCECFLVSEGLPVTRRNSKYLRYIVEEGSAALFSSKSEMIKAIKDKVVYIDD